MEPGKLNRLVSLQSRAAGRDAAGQPTSAFTEYAKVWANIRFLNGAETIKADVPTSIARASIRIRRGPVVTAGQRVVHEGTTYEIKAVLPDELLRERLDLTCEVINA